VISKAFRCASTDRISVNLPSCVTSPHFPESGCASCFLRSYTNCSHRTGEPSPSKRQRTRGASADLSSEQIDLTTPPPAIRTRSRLPHLQALGSPPASSEMIVQPPSTHSSSIEWFRTNGITRITVASPRSSSSKFLRRRATAFSRSSSRYAR
jgi:hypothetical protein